MAKISVAAGLDLSAYSYWQGEYNQLALVRSVLFDNTTITNLGLIYGAFCISNTKRNPSNSTGASSNDSISSSDSSLAWIDILRIIIVGFILGYSSRLAFGCNIGAFISGVSTGSLHGWVWLIFAFLGSVMILKCSPRLFSRGY